MYLFQLTFLLLFCTGALSAQEGWVLWYNQNQFAAADVPIDFIAKQNQLSQSTNVQINTVGLSPDGAWVLAYLNKASAEGKTHLSWEGTQRDFMNVLQPINEQKSEIQQIVFSPSLTFERQSWLILYDNKQADWKNIPSNLIQKIIELSRANKTIKTVGLAANDAWVLVADNNEVYFESIPTTLQLAIQGLQAQKKSINFISFNVDNAWVLFHDKNGALWEGIPDNLIHQINNLKKEDAQIRGVHFLTIKGKL